MAQSLSEERAARAVAEAAASHRQATLSDLQLELAAQRKAAGEHAR